ncbi:MAG: PorT family protein [Paludibacteraceae bacterium]|nr:PorT family protein [Paludibacteraceae bacterium]MBQ2607716.1 PorT family protein [Paludibacteraceae bacterium]
MVKVSKYILILVLCSLSEAVMVSVWAQPMLRAPEMYIGVQGGVEASTVLFRPTVSNMNDPFTNGVILGADAGFVFRYAAHKVCGVQVELNYMHRGWREHTETATYQRHLHYLEIPFLMHLYFKQEGKVRGFVNLGPQIGVCVGDSYSGIQPGAATSKQYQSIDNRFDWGLAGGLGMYVRTEKAGLYQLELRANYSLGGPYNTRATAYFSQAAPLDVSLNIGWLWPLNKKIKAKGERL